MAQAPNRSGPSAYIFVCCLIYLLEAAVGLPAFLLFHLWAYPHYRALIENTTDLDARIPTDGDTMGEALVEEALNEAHAWVKGLHLQPELGARAEKAAEVPWLKFRATMLKRIGKRPLGAVQTPG